MSQKLNFSQRTDFCSSIKFFSGGEKKSTEVKEQAVSEQESKQWETDQSEERLRTFDLQFHPHL